MSGRGRGVMRGGVRGRMNGLRGRASMNQFVQNPAIETESDLANFFVNANTGDTFVQNNEEVQIVVVIVSD